MEGGEFSNFAEICHRRWLSDILALDYSTNGGIDISGDSICIELKCRYDFYNHSFKIREYQVGQFRHDNPEHDLYWAFMLYSLHKRISRIGKRSVAKNIAFRRVFVFEWDWVSRFEVSYPETGPYVYVHESDFPDGLKKFGFPDGEIFVPPGSSIDGLLDDRKDLWDVPF